MRKTTRVVQSDRIMKSFLSILLFLVTVYGEDLSSEFTNSASLDEGSKVMLYWSVDSSDNTVHFAVQVNTSGWVGFGISSGQGKMKGADIVIGWVKDGKTYFSDRHGTGYSLPPKDDSQDYKLTGSEEKDGRTTLKFKRKIDTCDPQDNKIQDATTKVIFAYHPDDPSSPNDIPKHTVKGARSLMLLNAIKAPKLPDNLKHFDLLNNQTKLPANDTTYWCSAFEIPKFLKKHHIVKMEPIIQKGHEGIVHHILVYHCPNNFPPKNVSHSSACSSPDMPPAVLECQGMAPVGAWAVGGSAFYMPEHVGLPLGTDDSPKYVVMQTHYDNPDKRDDIVDSSGFRFYYTEKVRKHDGAILMTGAWASLHMIIPPKQPKWQLKGYCSAECTRKGMKNYELPSGGINVFAVLLHTHLVGRAARLRHIRNKVELPEIARDDNYDFNFQEFQILKKEVQIKPNDELETVCSYDTSERSKTTLGGESTRQEMCLSFLLYYPKVSLTQCTSADVLAFQSFYGTYFGNLTNYVDAWRRINSAKWNQTMVNGLSNAYRNLLDYYSLCSGEPGTTTYSGLANKVVINEPYIPKDACESSLPTSAESSPPTSAEPSPPTSAAKPAGVSITTMLLVLFMAAFVKLQ